MRTPRLANSRTETNSCDHPRSAARRRNSATSSWLCTVSPPQARWLRIGSDALVGIGGSHCATSRPPISVPVVPTGSLRPRTRQHFKMLRAQGQSGLRHDLSAFLEGKDKGDGRARAARHDARRYAHPLSVGRCKSFGPTALLTLHAASRARNAYLVSRERRPARNTTRGRTLGRAR